MGLFRSKKMKIGVLSNNGSFSYQVPKGEVNPSGLIQHLESKKVQDVTYLGQSELTVYLLNRREVDGGGVRILGWGGEDLAIVNDNGLCSVVVRLYGRLRVNAVRTECRLRMDPSSGAGIEGLISLSLDLPDGFPADVKASPHLRIVEEDAT